MFTRNDVRAACVWLYCHLYFFAYQDAIRHLDS